MNTDTGKLKWMILASVSTGAFLASMDSSIVNITLPTLVKDLHTDFTHVQWIVVSYLLIVTTMILPVGRLGDIFGKKKSTLQGLSSSPLARHSAAYLRAFTP